MHTLRPFAVVILACLALTSAARAQDVKAEKYTLSNGLTVILHEDHSLPVATINLWYGVGAKEEPLGRSGFAHLFEHLMFMGTRRVPGSDFDNLMEAGGGSNNASTSLDRTNYFSTGPAELLPTLLWLDADRLEDLGRFMTQEKLDLQRDVVRNEIRQNVENTPYGRADEDVEKIMYPVDHPYHKGVYGTHQDLEAATVNDVRDFFANFYTPSNCSLVVAGDFNPAEVKPLIEKLFGSIPATPSPVRRMTGDVPVPHLEKVARVTMFDNVEQPRISFLYHSPAHFANGDAEMDLIASMLTSGTSSRLYQRLILQDKLAANVVSYQASQTLSSIFRIDVYAIPGADLDAIEHAVDEELARLVQKGPTAEELAQHQAQVELGFLNRLTSLAARADQLNQYNFVWGEPNSFKRDLDRYRNATIESVQNWAHVVLSPQSRGIVRVLPMSADDRPPTARDEKPSVADAPEFSPPAPEEFTLASGIPVKLFRRPELPLVDVLMTFHAGGAGRKASGALVPPERAGAPMLLAAMLDQGTGDLDEVGFAQALESLGAAFGAGADQEWFSVSLSGIKRTLDQSVPLFVEALLRPALEQEDFDRVKRLHLEQLAQSEVEPQTVASRVAVRALFGNEHPYAHPTYGTPKSVEPIRTDDLRALHRALIQPGAASLYIAGDITRADVERLFNQALASWRPAAEPLKPVAVTPAKPADFRIVVVERPEAVQTVIRFAMPAPSATDPRQVDLRVLNTLLGGSFTSRLNRNLREEHGYTYGAGSRFILAPSTGYLIASSAVKADVTEPALAEFFKELERISKGPGDISADEAEKARKTFRTDVISSLEGLRGVTRFAAALDSTGRPWSSIEDDLARAAGRTDRDLNALAGPTGAIPLQNGVLVLVGDPAVIDQALENVRKAGRQLPVPARVTTWGDPVQTR